MEIRIPYNNLDIPNIRYNAVRVKSIARDKESHLIMHQTKT